MKSQVLFVAVLITAFPGQAFAQRANSEYSIAGNVIDSVTGYPVRHAELSIATKSGEIATIADDGGRFRFDHLEAGKYRLYASAPGYVREGLNQHGAFLTGVVTGNGLDSEHVTFRLHPQVLIYGRITDQNGEPVRNASVHLFSASRNSDQLPSMQAQQQTNDLGEYRFARLLAGRYFVAVQAQPWYAQTGFIYVPVETSGSHDFSHMPGGKSDPRLDVVYPITFYPGVTDERSAGELTLSEGESAQANIPLRTVPAVHLRVTNLPANENSPVAVNAFQRVFGTIPLGLQFQTAEVSPGEAEIAGLPPGELTFNLNRGQTAALERTMEANVGGSETLDASKPLPSAKISGRVVLPEDSVPIRDGNIMLLKAGDPTPFIHLEKDGSFAFGALPKGTYKVAVDLPGEPRYVQKVSASGATVSGRDVVITGTTDVRLTIVMGRGFGQVSGVVLRDNHGVDALWSCSFLTPA